MPTILVTNDDGIASQGLWPLCDKLKSVGRITVIAPESPRSATGMSLTFHKPLRVRKMSIGGRHGYAVSGNPADCVLLGVSQILSGALPDIVISGINLGDNVTAQTVFASGTVAAAMQGAVMGIKAIAFSLALPESPRPSKGALNEKLGVASDFAERISAHVLRKGLPVGVDYLNVNFPFEITQTTRMKITRLGRSKYADNVMERKDPRGRPYYWQWGAFRPSAEFERETDLHAVWAERSISITPMSLDSSLRVEEDYFKGLFSE